MAGKSFVAYPVTLETDPTGEAGVAAAAAGSVAVAGDCADDAGRLAGWGAAAAGVVLFVAGAVVGRGRLLES